MTIRIPQLDGVPFGWGGTSDGRLRVHRRCAEQFRKLFAAWDDAGLLPLLLTYDGAFAPRRIRGSTESLSAHAFGSAMDLNAAWNRLNRPPAPAGAKGSLVDLVPLANRHGFYWGGHFRQRPDAMHFEIARLA